MRWIGRLIRKMVRLTVFAGVFTVAVVVLDAVLSPDGPERRG